tara:strand:+ start:118 stop:480 length:363 start_codon:yes stop_codon:yes gene_type:complete
MASMNDKYLYFMEETDGAFDAAADAVTYPLSAFRGFYATGTTTTLEMHFTPLLDHGGEDASDKVTLTITANKQKEVIAALTRLFSAQPANDPFIVVADDSNSVFAHADITGCANAVTAVD